MKKDVATVWLLFDEGHEVFGPYETKEEAKAAIPHWFGIRISDDEYEYGRPAIEEWNEEEARELYPALFRNGRMLI